MIHDIVVAENIRRLIKEKGLKQYVVANRADIDVKEFSTLLNGRKQILSAYIPPIAQALDVTPNELFIKKQETA